MATPKGTIVLTGANGVRDASSAAALDSILRRNAVGSSSTVGDQRPGHEMLALDLCRPSSVREAAATINAKVQSGAIPRIQALILNAGLREAHGQIWTDEGLDTTFASNYLGHWLLMLLLLQSMNRESGRVVVLGGIVHDPLEPPNKINRAFVEDEWKQILADASSGTVDVIAKGEWSASPADLAKDPRGLSGIRRYGAAKLCLVMMIVELQNRLNSDPRLSHISILGVDPGTMPTHIAVGDHGWLVKFIMTVVMQVLVWQHPDDLIRTPQKSASDVLTAALAVDSPIGSMPKSVYLDGSPT
ncbi:putative short-chain dehydrogenase [Nemania serpens]|nr:putative short-chain dehydrogenase [Nemania serpens]